MDLEVGDEVKFDVFVEKRTSRKGATRVTFVKMGGERVQGLVAHLGASQVGVGVWFHLYLIMN